MIKASLHLCFVTVAVSIIVTEPPLATDYKYSYTIEDPTTGDSKSQLEVRQGDVVKGTYSVVGPDGTKRIVEYIADDKNGFKAVIREEASENAKHQPVKNPPYNVYDKFENPAYNFLKSTPYVKENLKAVVEDPIEVQTYEAYNNVQSPVYSSEQNSPNFYAVKYSANVLFTPANEIQSNRLAVQKGKYFEPAFNK